MSSADPDTLLADRRPYPPGYFEGKTGRVRAGNCRITDMAIELVKSGIKVAEYMTELPKRELLEQKLHKAVELARKRLEAEPTERNTEYK